RSLSGLQFAHLICQSLPLVCGSRRMRSAFSEGSSVNYAAIGPIAIHFPERVETNAQLQAEFPSWDMPLIFEKTGIASRHIAAPGECASDLAVAATKKLFHEADVDPQSIDFVLLCTQTPDYPLPT